MSDEKAKICIDLKRATDEVQRLKTQNKTLIANNLKAQGNLKKLNQDLMTKNEVYNLLTCIDCGKTMDDKVSLNTHMKTDHIETNVNNLVSLKEDTVNLQGLLDEMTKKNANME